MATIAATSMTGSGARELTETTMTSSDTFTYNSGKDATLILRNATGGALTPNFDGDGGTTKAVAGIGSVDVSSGLTLGSIAAGEVWAIPLDTISAYLQGTITVTGGTGIVAVLLEY